MIVVTKSYGQLGNRLFLFAHLIAAARHYGTSVANPCFAEYAHLFPATAKDLWCRYPRVPLAGALPSLRRRKALAKSVYLGSRTLSTAKLTKYPLQIVRLRGDQTCDLAAPPFAKLMNSGRQVLVDGWQFRSEPLLAQHADAIRDHFCVDDEKQSRIDRLIDEVRESADRVVGVHIRHGDYATFHGGKYFYRVPQYAQAMRRVADQLPGQRTRFFVCSNAQVSESDFEGLNVTFGSGDLIEDLYGFAQTDLLMGPPSTFTLWASFYGQVPLSVMQTAEHYVDATMLPSLKAA